MKPKNPKQVKVETSRKVTPPPMMSAPFTGIRYRLLAHSSTKNQSRFSNKINMTKVILIRFLQKRGKL